VMILIRGGSSGNEPSPNVPAAFGPLGVGNGYVPTAFVMADRSAA
jgi:hypothetical protein